MNSTYQEQVSALGELNRETFKAEVRTAIAQSEARLTIKFLDKHLELMKWLFFVYWFLGMLLLGGLMMLLVRR